MNFGEDEDAYEVPEGLGLHQHTRHTLVSPKPLPRTEMQLTDAQAIAVLEDAMAQDTAEPYSRFLDDERAAIRQALAALKRGM